MQLSFNKIKFIKMNSTNQQTNWLAVITAAVAGTFIGATWYSFLFAEAWMKATGVSASEDGLKAFKNGVEITEGMNPMIANTFAMALYAVILNWLLQRASAKTLQSGAMIGGAIGLMSLVSNYVNNMFAAEPSTLSMIDGSYALVLFTVMGAILGAWQKK